MFGRLKKKIVVCLGENNKTSFKKSLPQIASSVPAKSYNANIVSMSGKKYFLDQLFSLFSFYYNVGVPLNWTIYNDGTYTDDELNFFKTIDKVTVKNIVVDEEFKPLTEKFTTLKKVFIFKNTNPDKPTMFVDSDVLFFKSFQKDIEPFINNNCYLVDEGQGYFDKDLPDSVSGNSPLNLGFILLNSKVDWTIVLNYLKSRIVRNELNYWSDQTAFHILAQKENFTALPEEKFVTGGKDAFTIANAVDYSNIALRHFVGPIRHKMWQMNWKKLPGIK